MSPENYASLIEKYPELFPERNGKLGCEFSCGDGWYNILDLLCAQIQHRVTSNNMERERAIKFNDDLKLGIVPALYKEDFEAGKVNPRKIPKKIKQPKLAQVKEKFGGLRFYIDDADEIVHAYIQMAENLASITCEVCGNKGKMENIHGWVRTVCDEHSKETND